MVQLEGGDSHLDLTTYIEELITETTDQEAARAGVPDIIVETRREFQNRLTLIDNGRRGRAVTGATDSQVAWDMLSCKQDASSELTRCCVDYSGRSVIVVGPELEI